MEHRKLHTIKDFLNSKKGKEISTLPLNPLLKSKNDVGFLGKIGFMESLTIGLLEPLFWLRLRPLLLLFENSPHLQITMDSSWVDEMQICFEFKFLFQMSKGISNRQLQELSVNVG